MTAESRQDQVATRRCVLLGAGALGAAGVLSACSSSSVPYGANDAGQAPASATAAGMDNTQMSTAMASQSASAMSSMSGMSTAASGTLLGSTSEIPVGGGMVFVAEKVVVTQPTANVYKAFSAVCTHVGCVCNAVSMGTIDCPCHGSKFKITDGSVVTGPAPTALASKTINVTDGKIYLE